MAACVRAYVRSMCVQNAGLREGVGASGGAWVSRQGDAPVAGTCPGLLRTNTRRWGLWCGGGVRAYVWSMCVRNAGLREGVGASGGAWVCRQGDAPVAGTCPSLLRTNTRLWALWYDTIGWICVERVCDMLCYGKRGCFRACVGCRKDGAPVGGSCPGLLRAFTRRWGLW